MTETNSEILFWLESRKSLFRSFELKCHNFGHTQKFLILFPITSFRQHYKRILQIWFIAWAFIQNLFLSTSMQWSCSPMISLKWRVRSLGANGCDILLKIWGHGLDSKSCRMMSKNVFFRIIRYKIIFVWCNVTLLGFLVFVMTSFSRSTFKKR